MRLRFCLFLFYFLTDSVNSKIYDLEAQELLAQVSKLLSTNHIFGNFISSCDSECHKDITDILCKLSFLLSWKIEVNTHSSRFDSSLKSK